MIKNGLIGLAVLLLAWPACAAESPASAPVAASAPPAGETALADLAAAKDGERLTVPVLVNGQGPFQFLVDTGADGTVISGELADALALPKGRRMSLHAHSGVRDVRTVSIREIGIASKVLKNINAPVLLRSNLGADGVIGVDSLRGLRIDIDFQTGSMQVLPGSKPGARQHLESGEILVTAKSHLGQLIMADADANGQKVWVVVDTGGQASLGNSRLRKLLVRNSRMPAVRPVTFVDVLGEPLNADFVIVEKLRIGGFMMQGAGIAFADAHPFKEFALANKPSMLLGMDGLRNFRRVSIDFSGRTIRFLLPVGTPGIN